jgi:hypothetical protein
MDGLGLFHGKYRLELPIDAHLAIFVEFVAVGAPTALACSNLTSPGIGLNAVTIVIAAAAIMIAVESLRPGVIQPKVPGWILRLALLNAVQVAVVYLAAATWDRWLPQFRL